MRCDIHPYVDVDRDDCSAKPWLAPVALARNPGFSAHELRRLRGIVESHRTAFLASWNGRADRDRLAARAGRRLSSRGPQAGGDPWGIRDRLSGEMNSGAGNPA